MSSQQDTFGTKLRADGSALVYSTYLKGVISMKRVTKLGGMLILCPGTCPIETKAHDFLVSQGFSWSVFEEPQDGMKRKYWKLVE
jgi:hypothetical protein